MLRSLVLLGLMFFDLTLHAEVSKDFLIKLRTKFKSTLGAPVNSFDFYSELSPEETAFIEKTNQFDYTDIFKGTLPKTPELYKYNFMHWRGLFDKRLEKKLRSKQVCRMVYTEDGKNFVTHKLKGFTNPSADKGIKGWKFSYCAGWDKESDMDSVVYYFHGVTGNPYNFVDRGATYAVREGWREFGRMPRWVSVSLGSVGHMGEKGREDRFFDIVVPYIEKEMGFKERPKKRFGLGISQGGANVLHAVLKREKFFDAAVAVCPAVIAMDPFADSEAFDEYRKRTGASKVFMTMAFTVMPSEFYNPNYWSTHVDSLMLGQRLMNQNTTPLYIQTSSKDQLGLQEGGQIFAMLARTMGAPVIFEELEGKHCVLRPRRVASFFTSFQQGLPWQMVSQGY